MDRGATIHVAAPNERLGLFVLRPEKSAGYTESVMRVIDNEIDDVAWRMTMTKQSGVRIGVFEGKDKLTSDLENWIEGRAA